MAVLEDRYWVAISNITWHFPNQFILESDINSNIQSIVIDTIGSYKPEWNATITKQLFNHQLKSGSLKLQVNNILNKKNKSEYTAETESFDIKNIPRFFMCSFIYKFALSPHNNSLCSREIFEIGIQKMEPYF